MKSLSFLLALFFVFTLTAIAQDTSFAVSSNGNVGIGTTNPANLLDVNGITNIRGALYLGNSANSNIVADDLTLYLRSSAGVVLQNAIGTSTHSYFNNNGNSFINALGGNLGIGTTNPQAKLDVRGDIITGTAGSGGSLILNSRDNSTLGGMIVWKGAASYKDWGQENYYDNMRFYSNSSGISNFQIFSNGGGTTNLNVQGEIQTQPTGDANMVPIAYANVNSDGTLETAATTDNVTFGSHSPGTGNYYFTITGWNVHYLTTICVATIMGSEGGEISWGSLGGGAELAICTRSSTGSAADKPFTFIVYKK